MANVRITNTATKIKDQLWLRAITITVIIYALCSTKGTGPANDKSDVFDISMTLVAAFSNVATGVRGRSGRIGAGASTHSLMTAGMRILVLWRTIRPRVLRREAKLMTF